MKSKLLIVFISSLLILGLTNNNLSTQATSTAETRVIRLQPGLATLAAKPGQAEVTDIAPAMEPLSQPIYIGTKLREQLIKSGSDFLISADVEPLLPTIPVDAPSRQVVITSDFQSQRNVGGAILALRDSNNDGVADQQTVMADNIVEIGDAITKIVASQLIPGRYFAITENSELLQIDDANRNYIADNAIFYDDFRTTTGIGLGLATTVLADGTEAIYLLRIEPGPDRFFYTADDTANMAVFLDRNGNNQIDSISRFLTTRRGFSSLGGFCVGVGNSLLFNLGQYDNTGSLIAGAIYSYYDANGDGIPEDFSPNNNGMFAQVQGGDRRPAIATDIVQVGTNFYVTAPMTALGLARNDDIAVYSDLNASQVADSGAILFSSLTGLSDFSSDLGGLAVSPDARRVATVRNLINRGNIQESRILMFNDENFNFQADASASKLFDNGINGIAGICFSNNDLLGPQPILIFPRLKSSGKFLLDAPGSRISVGAMLVVDSKERFVLKLNGNGSKWIINGTTLSVPGNLTVTQALGNALHQLTIENTSGQQSLPVLFQR